MLIEKIIYTLPFEFYITLLAVTLIYFLLMVLYFISSRIRISHMQFELYSIEDSILMHQGCHIENLPLISGLFESSTRILSIAYDKMIQISIDFYQKKWIPNPASFISVDTITDKSTLQRIKGYGFGYFSLAGLLISFISLLTGIIIFKTQEQITSTIIISLIPLIICILFSLLFFIERLRNHSAIENATNSLNAALSQKLPVFSDYNSLSLLISQFLEYDRNMTKSVDRLGDQIENFVVDGLTTAVTQSIEKTLMECISPSIERATEAIVALSKDVVEKENSGMRDLAVKFSAALSDEMTYQFEPMVKQISEVANTLSNSKNYLDVASKSLDAYKQNAIGLQALTSKTLIDYEQSKATFSQDIHTIANSFEQFNISSVKFNENAISNQKQFESAANTLKESIVQGNNVLSQLVDGIFNEAKNAQRQALESQKINESYLDMMKIQIDGFTREFSSHNNELFTGLTSTISEFTDKQAAQLVDQQEKAGSGAIEMMRSMEKAAKDIKSSSEQIKHSFDELQTARILEEEYAKNKKSRFFRRKE